MTQDVRCCTLCSETKPLTPEHFIQRVNGSYTLRCRACSARLKAQTTDSQREKARAHAKEYYHANKASRRAAKKAWDSVNRAHVRKKHLNAQSKYIHGITRQQYESRLSAQGNRCAICSTDQPGGCGRFHLDHDHTTGRLRGFLCSRCNQGLGRFLDNPDLFEAAAEYVERHATSPTPLPVGVVEWVPPRLPRDARTDPVWRAANSELYRRLMLRWRIKSSYGITLGQYEAKLAEQGGRCGLCRTADPGAKGAFHLDHDHVTGRIRDFLCVRCNHGLGYFKDSAQNLRASAKYLRFHSGGGWAASFDLAG